MQRVSYLLVTCYDDVRLAKSLLRLPECQNTRRCVEIHHILNIALAYGKEPFGLALHSVGTTKREPLLDQFDSILPIPLRVVARKQVIRWDRPKCGGSAIPNSRASSHLCSHCLTALFSVE